mgnify:CR=1 FL=1|jgi:hypothetical protein|tara:strand:- start:626 stop:823 length:198 start_codon:yes stop_codon:yes gene_type:complete
MYRVMYRVVGTKGSTEAVRFSNSPKRAWQSAFNRAEGDAIMGHYLGVDWAIFKGSKLIGSGEWSD